MNQQRSRRFRSAQEAREAKELEQQIKDNLIAAGHVFENDEVKSAWDSNVITPGTEFMLNLSEYVRFYIRKRIAEDEAWKKLTVVFSDASIPGEGEHKIMAHIRHQRTKSNYNPNLVHVLHGLDADLIMLALATHEAHFYIMREKVLFGRRGAENAERMREESGFADAQQRYDEEAGVEAMSLPENKGKILQRISIPILREYLAFEFDELLKSLYTAGFKEVSFERLIDDFVFLCFFVGNDFLPHLPSLDIRDGALDFLFNVYKRVLPTLGDFITNHGGEVNLSHVDVILAEVGEIEDYVFQMKHSNEQQYKRQKEQEKARRKGLKNGQVPHFNHVERKEDAPKVRGRAARILNEQQKQQQEKNASSTIGTGQSGSGRALGRDESARSRHAPKEVSKKSLEDNRRAAELLKASLSKVSASSNTDTTTTTTTEQDGKDESNENSETNGSSEPNEQDKSSETNTGSSTENVPEVTMEGDEEEKKESGEKRKADEITADDDNAEGTSSSNAEEKEGENSEAVDDTETSNGVVSVEDDDDDDEEEEKDEEDEEEKWGESSKLLKNKMKEMGQKKLNEYAENVEDKVRLHEAGWKNRYYTDKCKADDVLHNGGKEHLFRSYIMGLCWVMKYYYEGCPSWKWYYPFHYAPFASDLKNIERFEKDCKFELCEPFRPVEQLMAVLPEDSAHAIPKAARWLMSDRESPILDFYPKEVLCDPNGKAMPWLWVVLLPFIDEERLLSALHATMKEWTEAELRCNAKGANDGLIYCHVSHKLSPSILPSLDTKDTTKKFPIEECDLSGFFQRPIDTEVYPLDKVSVIHPPVTYTKISSDNIDELLTSPIETNVALCASFTEPPKAIHKSVLLEGAQPPTPVLQPSDFQIRRPKLSRGGTIANMGGGRRGQSHQVGYGSMNIGSYERELAYKSGRGNQLNQAGTRQWGAMEPTPKRHRNGYAPQQHYNPNQQGYNNNHHQQQYRPAIHQPHHSNSYQSRGGNGGHHNNGYNGHNGNNQRQRWQPPPGPPQNQGYNQRQGNNNGNRWQAPPPPHHFPPPPQHGPGERFHPNKHYQQQQQQPRPGHDFQNFNNNNRGGHSYSRHGQQQQNYHRQQQQHQQQNQGRSGLSTNVMSSLRSQLASTLSRNRQGSNNSNQRR